MARAQLLAAALVVLAVCCRCQRAPPSPYFFYPPQRGYVRQVPVPVPVPVPRGVTQTVYVVVEDASDVEGQRELLDALPSLLEMLSAGGAGSAFSPAKTPVFVDDSEPQFDKNAWHQDQSGAGDEGNSKQQDTAEGPVPGEAQPTEYDSTVGSESLQLEDPKEPSDPPHLDYPIDVRSGFAGGRAKLQKSTLG